MIFVLIFMLFFGFAIFNKTHKNGKLKYKERMLKLCFVKEKQCFYFSAANFFSYEAKELLKSNTRVFAQLVDEILCKVRLLAPQGGLSSKELDLKRKKIGQKAVYILDNTSSEAEFAAVCVALGINDFFPVYFGGEQKELLEKFSKINYYKSSSKEFFTLCQKLNVNLSLPKQPKVYFLKENFNFAQPFQKTRVLADNYLLTRFQNKQLNFYVYNFFAKGTICVCVCENLTQEQNEFSFKFFYDLANSNLNYFDIKQNNNFAVIKDELTQDITYLNFSHTPATFNTSCLKNVKKSNLPCVELGYTMLLKPKEKVELAFMLSKNPQPLENLNLKKVAEISQKNLEKFFDFSVIFPSKAENEFFSTQIVTKAKAAVLNFGKKKFFSVSGDYDALKKKYKSNEIDELCFFVSIKSQLFSYEEAGVKISPYFIKGDFKLLIFGFKNPICVVQKGLKSPCLVLDGVRYYNHLLVSYNALTNSEVKIEC